MIDTVSVSARARKELRRCPIHIVRKLWAWVEAVQLEGLEETRRLRGFHGEALKGPWKGHRSVRLSRAYRAIYRIHDDGVIEFVLIETVSKHEY